MYTFDREFRTRLWNINRGRDLTPFERNLLESRVKNYRDLFFKLFVIVDLERLFATRKKYARKFNSK